MFVRVLINIFVFTDPLPVKDEWMERVDMTSFLDMDKQTPHRSLFDLSKRIPQKSVHVPAVQNVKAEPRKANEETGPKPGRLRLLQELLLQGVPQKTPASPEAQVAPDIDVLECLTERSVLNGDNEIAAEICFDSYSADPLNLSDSNSVIVESWNREGSLSSVSSASGYSLDSSFESSSHTTNASTQSNIGSDYMDDAITQPLSDDLESILSGSAPSSPCSDDPEYLPDLVEPSKRSKKCRQTPYSRGQESLNRKEKKKLQNKNAAIRYRQKKKAESESVKGEEDILAKHNAELRDKVDQISREIKYMKDLMAEVYKAKRVKIKSQKH